MTDSESTVAPARSVRSLRDDRGQGLVEYALILALVSLAAIVALGFLSGKINSLFSKSGNTLNNVQVASSTPPPPPPPPTAGSVAIQCSGGSCDGGDTMTAVMAGWTGVTTFTFSWRRNTDNFEDCQPGGSGWVTTGITPNASSNPITNVPVAGLWDPYEVSVVGSNAGGSTAPVRQCVIVFPP